jgi:hypothetical protein
LQLKSKSIQILNPSSNSDSLSEARSFSITILAQSIWLKWKGIM